MKVAKLYQDAVVPKRKYSKDAGLDLYAYLDDMDEYVVHPGDITTFRTGVTVEIPKGYFGWVANKSSKDWLIGGGIIDETYQGEILVKVINVTDDILHFYHGDALGQLLIIPCITPEVELVDIKDIHKDKTDRGGDGGIVRQMRLIG